MSVAEKAGSVAKVAPAVGLVALALGIVYVVWGSTYLAIRVVVQEAPPLTSMGLRYFAASILLGTILAIRGGIRRLAVTKKEALGAAFLGLMLPVLGNGMVSVGENLGAPSGATALLIAVTPLMIVVFRSIEGDRPPRSTLVGVLLGFGGLAYLVLTGRGDGGRDLPIGAALIIVGAATCWAFGSYRQGRLWLPADVFVTTVYEMLFGGLILLAIGQGSGEHFSADYSLKIWAALAYLVVFGSVIGFTAYVWLVSSAPISLVATYAYINPVVAVFLGWLILSEKVGVPIFVGGGIVVLAVALVIRSERPRKRQPSTADIPDPPR